MEDLIQLRGDGNAMKRIINFNFEANQYVLNEDSAIVFSIDQTSMQFDSTLFYQGLFSEGKDYTDIELINVCDINSIGIEEKKALYLYKSLNSIIKEICLELQKTIKSEG